MYIPDWVYFESAYLTSEWQHAGGYTEFVFLYPEPPPPLGGLSFRCTSG